MAESNAAAEQARLAFQRNQAAKRYAAHKKALAEEEAVVRERNDQLHQEKKVESTILAKQLVRWFV